MRFCAMMQTCCTSDKQYTCILQLLKLVQRRNGTCFARMLYR